MAPLQERKWSRHLCGNERPEHASTRTKDDIEKISHVYLDLDHGGTASLEALENSDLVPRPNYVLDTSPGKLQVVWKVDGMSMEEAEALNQAMVREFDGDPAATDSTRVLRLPGFANKKYEADFYVRARAESRQTYHLRDFKLQIDSQDASRHHHEEVGRKQSAATGALSQSEHDWAYAKRALVRGDEPELIIQRIADYRSEDKADPNYYARHTVNKAQAELQSRAPIGRPTESNSLVTNEPSQEK
jgi:RepB DNA-primase from phage plasmid